MTFANIVKKLIDYSSRDIKNRKMLIISVLD